MLIVRRPVTLGGFENNVLDRRARAEPSVGARFVVSPVPRKKKDRCREKPLRTIAVLQSNLCL